MSSNSNNLSQFWQELKRRKVIRTITVYAAAAFVILELLSIIIEPLRLPDWTLQFAIIFLCIGFIVAIFLSWIYDFHPVGGVVKTEPAHKVKIEDFPKSSNSWKIASYISFIVILGLLSLNIFSKRGESKRRADFEQSIAVLPFHNDSPEQKNTHIIDGCMVQILNNLSKIQDLRVSARASVEVYREQSKPPVEIAQELGVSYLLNGSGQKIENRILLTFQLVDSDGNIIWSQPYERRIQKAADQFSLQSEIAELVAEEIDVRITPEEKRRIESIPTQSAIAHELFLKGHEEIAGYIVNQRDESALETAKILLSASLVFDSSYADVYMDLANISWLQNFNKQYYSETYLDSAFSLASHALSFDAQLSEAYTLRGQYYLIRGDYVSALEEFNQAIQLNSNDWMALHGLASYYGEFDIPRSLDYYKQVFSLYKGPRVPSILRDMGELLSAAGFVDEAVTCYQRATHSDGDTIGLYSRIIESYINNELFEKAKSMSQKLSSIDSSYLQSGWLYMILGDKQEALKHYERWWAQVEATGEVVVFGIHRLALAYWINGFREEAESFFNQQLNQIHAEQKLDRWHDALLYTYFDLASIQAFQGEKQKALENLRKFNEKKIMKVYIPTHIKYGLFFDEVKSDPEFKEIFEEIEAKYQKEHERVGQWLEENDLLSIILS